MNLSDIPFKLTRCSWPRPVATEGRCWISEPEWGAPPMPYLPQPYWTTIQGDVCWTLSWQEFFRRGVTNMELSGQMRGFHVVFELEILSAGTLVFWDDDGCIIRRAGGVIHGDRTAHHPVRHEIEVRAGERLEVAQWQLDGGWLWGARLQAGGEPRAAAGDLLQPYRARILHRLKDPNGPPLKMYFGGGTPVRTVLSAYSMLLNGYRPSKVLVFGEYQWDAKAREFFSEWFPFAEIVPTESVFDRLRAIHGPPLVRLATQLWFVMKTCSLLFHPPHEFGYLDDDVFILGGVDDALEAFGKADLVFAPDCDYNDAYLAAWGPVLGGRGPLKTRRLNTGLFWLRNMLDPQMLAGDLLRVPAHRTPLHIWEQGYFAVRFGEGPVHELPGQRYFYPIWDGLPGGPIGYDYEGNPCGFTSVHFGGIPNKPSDAAALLLARSILDRGLGS